MCITTVGSGEHAPTTIFGKVRRIQIVILPLFIFHVIIIVIIISR